MSNFDKKNTKRTTGARESGLHKTGIRGIQDARQIVDGKTYDNKK